MKYVIVGFAGVIGALLRYAVGLLIAKCWNASFPIATLFINLLGCFFLAYFTAYLFRKKRTHPYIAVFIGTGLIGSFTTFSAFSVETIQLFNQHQYGMAFTYVFTSAIGGLLISWTGLRVGNKQWKQYVQEENQ